MEQVKLDPLSVSILLLTLISSLSFSHLILFDQIWELDSPESSVERPKSLPDNHLRLFVQAFNFSTDGPGGAGLAARSDQTQVQSSQALRH